MADPAYRISDFFKKLGNLESFSEFQVFMRQYWYVWTIISIIILIMIIMNVLMCIYFRRRHKPYKRTGLTNLNAPPSTKTIIVPQKVKPAGPVSSALNDTVSQFAMEALITNNKYRALHNAPPLKYNDSLAKIAQEWAEELAKTQKLQHSPPNWRQYKNVPLGENIAYLFNFPMTGEKMIDMWYSESITHDYSLDHQPHSEQFSQMIWKGSNEVGFGRVRGPNGEWWYGVGIYMPQGNIIGYYAQNVLPPTL